MFQERIRESYEVLTPGFRRLADFIMNSTLDVAFLTATELSRRVGVDPATVVRFAQELGYSGYRELSREIKRYVRDQVTATHREVREAESTVELLRALVENANQNLQHFVTTDLQNVVAAVELLRNAPRIWFTGEFSGYDVAAFMAKQALCYGIPAEVFQPSMGETAANVLRMAEGDVLVVYAGNDPGVDAGYAIRMAHSRGVKAITLTSSGVILPARLADVTIIVPGKSPLGVPVFGTQMQVLSLIWEAVLQVRAVAAEQQQAQLRTKMEQLLTMRAETQEYEVAALADIWNQQQK